jgi:hypothetical protein
VSIEPPVISTKDLNESSSLAEEIPLARLLLSFRSLSFSDPAIYYLSNQLSK